MDKLSVLLISAICCVVCICSGVVYTAWIDVSETQQAEAVRKEEETAVIAMNDDTQVINGGGTDMWIRAKVRGPLAEGKTKTGFKADKEKGNWCLRQDGYYYYSAPVSPGELSEPLIAAAENKPQGKEKRISIQAEAIQINWVSKKAGNSEDAFRRFKSGEPLQHYKSRFI